MPTVPRTHPSSCSAIWPVAFRFRVRDVQGVKRLNQNRQPADRAGIIEGLRASGAAGAVQIAELMSNEERS